MDLPSRATQPGAMGPIAIGGVGGSGTRIVAGFIRALGVYIGSDVNPALDNKWFTLMFKRRSWSRVLPSDRDELTACEVFTGAMTGRTLDHAGKRALNAASMECFFKGHNVKGSGRGAWAWRVRRSLLEATRCVDTQTPWGWKEPNTHLFIPTLASAMSGLRYIHVIRDGLVMADSTNWDQAALWSQRFEIQSSSAGNRPPSFTNRLVYWIRANRAAVEAAEKHLGNRFRLIRFENLTEDPEDTLLGLADWLALQVRGDAKAKIRSVQPSRRGRSRLHSEVSMSEGDLKSFVELGYDLDKPSR